MIVERVKAESAEASAKTLEEIQRKTQQMLEDREKIYQEYVRQLTKKIESERAQMQEEQRNRLALKLQVFTSITLKFLFNFSPLVTYKHA